MALEYSLKSDLEILRQAEQERGEAIGAFFRWLFTKPEVKTEDFTGDVAAAE